MRTLIFVGLLALSYGATAEETVCKVKGMHCKGCQEMVEGKVCDEKQFSLCQVSIVDTKKEIGEIKLTTKDPNAKVDQKFVGAKVTDAGYKLEGCAPSSAVKAGAKKKAG